MMIKDERQAEITRILHHNSEIPESVRRKRFPAERTGKQVFINGAHLADATTEDNAQIIVDALNGGNHV